MWVYGNSYECGVVCVVVPNLEALVERITEAGVVGGEHGLRQASAAVWCTSPGVQGFVLEELVRLGREEKVCG